MMNFLIKKDRIVKILSKVQGLTGKISNLAITENVLIEAKNTGITIKATDLETAFEGSYPAKVKKKGDIVVNAKKIYEILKQFPDSDVFIEEIKNKRIRISNSKICYDIVANTSENFPLVAEINEGIEFDIKSVVFRNMIKQTTIINTTPGEKRPHISGVLLEINDKDRNFELRMVSTDANRLSVVNYLLEDYRSKKEVSILIPKKGLNEVIKFIDADELLNIEVKGNSLVVRKKYETIIVRLLEGEFPEYREIIRKKNGSVIELSNYTFTKTLKRMSILTSERSNSILFAFNDNKMLVIAKNAEYGESKEEVAINFSEKKIEAAFNPKFLLDTLSVMEGDIVFINIIDGNKPCIIEGADEYSFISVIMPMRV